MDTKVRTSRRSIGNLSRLGGLVACSVLASAALLMSGAEAVAQDLVIGVRGGINSANVSADDPDLIDTRSRTGFVGGVFFDIPVTRVFSIQPELLYSSKGFKLDAVVPGGEVTATADFDYFEIPILLKLNLLSRQGVAQPVIYAGGAFAFETSCGVSAQGAVTVSSGCEGNGEFDVEERAKTDISLLFGGGLDLDAGPAIIVLDVRYNIGLTNLDTSDSGDSAKSRVWSFTAGVGFPIGR